jgi:Ca2+/Na+ antiporter
VLIGDKDPMCSNSLLSPPTSAIGKIAMGGASFLVLSYLFIGIAVLTEKLYDAITVITSKSKVVGLKDSEGKAMQVKIPAWTSTMANLTLLAFASALPEIFLTSLGVFTTPVGSVPAELGPMTLIGSASFNLLIVAGIAAASVRQITAVTQIGTFLLNAAFAAAAYIWLFTILTITTAGYITLAEALTTLCLYPVLLVLAHAVDLCKKDAEFDDNRRRVCRHALQCIAEQQGRQHVLEQATGFAGDEADQAEASRI